MGWSCAVHDDADATALLDDELHGGVRGILDERHRAGQAGDVDVGAELRARRRRDRQQRDDTAGQDDDGSAVTHTRVCDKAESAGMA